MKKMRTFLYLIVALFVPTPIQSCPSACDCMETTSNCSSGNLINVPEIPPKTTRLILSYNRVTQENLLEVFSYKNIEVLSLEGNGLTAFPFDLLQSMDSLQHLFLDDNLITKLPVLHHLSLTELSLGKNRITSIQGDTFADLVSLRKLNLSSNEIQIIADRRFPSSLQELNLDFNSITSITPSAFHNLKQLQKLSLYGLATNFNKSDVESMLDGMLQLKSLKLSGLGKGHFNFSRIIANVRNLETLSMRSAKIQILPPSVVSELKKLKELDLSDNELSTVPNLFGSHNLAMLDLSNNRLEQVTHDDFFYAEKLRELHLSHNAIRTISSRSFHTLHDVQIIDLSFNRLSTLQIGTFNISNNKLYLALHHNPWQCDCSFVTDFYSPLLQCNNIELICKSQSSCMECAGPDQHRGLTLSQNTTYKSLFNESETTCGTTTTTYPTSNWWRRFPILYLLLIGAGGFLLVLTINIIIVCRIKKPKPAAAAVVRGRNSVRLTSISYRDSADLSFSVSNDHEYSQIAASSSYAFARPGTDRPTDQADYAFAWDNQDDYAYPAESRHDRDLPQSSNTSSAHHSIVRKQLSHDSTLSCNASLRKYVCMRSFASRHSSTTSTQVDCSVPTSPSAHAVIEEGQEGQEVRFFPSYGNVTFDAKMSCKDVYLAPSLGGASTKAKDDEKERSRFGTYVEIDFDNEP